jgi:hypothetical protein
MSDHAQQNRDARLVGVQAHHQQQQERRGHQELLQDNEERSLSDPRHRSDDTELQPPAVTAAAASHNTPTARLHLDEAPSQILSSLSSSSITGPAPPSADFLPKDIAEHSQASNHPGDSSGTTTEPSHHLKSIRPLALAIMSLNKGRQFSTSGTSAHRKRQMSTLIEKEGAFGPALTVSSHCVSSPAHRVLSMEDAVRTPLWLHRGGVFRDHSHLVKLVCRQQHLGSPSIL